MKVLIVSTSLGAGHNGMALELSQQLAEGGHSAHIVDYLDLLPLKLGRAVSEYYRAQLRYAPATYERSYELFPRIHRQFAAVNGLLSERSVRSAVKRTESDLVVSNNPHASMALGYLRKQQHISIPVATYVTDFGVHPLWVHPSIDAHFVVHEQSKLEANKLGANNVSVVEPLVSKAFTPADADFRLRNEWDLDDEACAVLITAGSWGVGELEQTVDDVLGVPNTVPIVVCGNDARLKTRLSSRHGCRALGWTDRMPELMASVDVLVENAGGLTSLEALKVGLPVISYRPIPGHGRHNARSMEAAHVTTYARNANELRAAIADANKNKDLRRRTSIATEQLDQLTIGLESMLRLSTTSPNAPH